jgi:riboflavin biosynthesis pyrimidine reductase
MRDVARELTALYGTAAPPGPGVLHVMHVARTASGRLGALRIGAPATPKSESDFFVVNATRAHADAVLTSAENLRREPALSHALQGPWAEALARYRSQALGKHAPLTCAILTRSGDLPDPHPVWSDGTVKLILMPAPERPLPSPLPGGEGTREGTRANPLPPGEGMGEGTSAGPHGARILRIPDLDAVSAVRWLAAHGCAAISVEAGPHSVQSLYAANAVDELWLTHWESPTKEAEFAGALPDDGTLFAGLALVGSSRRNEGGQTFRFERWARVRP